MHHGLNVVDYPFLWGPLLSENIIIYPLPDPIQSYTKALRPIRNSIIIVAFWICCHPCIQITMEENRRFSTTPKRIPNLSHSITITKATSESFNLLTLGQRLSWVIWRWCRSALVGKISCTIFYMWVCIFSSALQRRTDLRRQLLCD